MLNSRFFGGIVFAVIMFMFATLPACSTPESRNTSEIEKSLTGRTVVIGHRGASGHRPEHTLESYRLAIEFGADFIEPDLVATRDGILVSRHENEISGTTDAAEKFPSRKRSKIVDGKTIEGWFTEDFTLKELKTLKAKERLPFRNHAFDGKFDIPTFEEIIVFVKQKEKEKNRVIGICPELKHSSYFSSIGLPLEGRFVALLEKYGYTEKTSPVLVQSFEVSNLKVLSKLTKVRLLQLLDEPEERPYDGVLQGDARTYGDLAKPEGLREVASYAYAIGPYKRMIVPEGPDQIAGKPTSLVRDAHAVGLVVMPFTFRSEARYLLPVYSGNPEAEYAQFFSLGVDGLFSDFPDVAVRARDRFWPRQ